MSANFEISEARTADTEAIASLFALSWVSPFTCLQFGQIEPAQLAAMMVPHISARMAKKASKFVLARYQGNGEVVAVAQWTIPVVAEGTIAKGESIEDHEEQQQFEDEAYRRNLPATSNKDLIMAFTLGLRRLRNETLRGRRHFLLENLATHPDHRGKGLASQLVEWSFTLADEQQVLVYLDTANDNPAARLYRKLGFEEYGQNTIEDLSRFTSSETLRQFGCDNEHTHVAFLRFPRAFKQVTIDLVVENTSDFLT